MVLGDGGSGAIGPTLNAADIAARDNDGYLEAYARGPGRGWFVMGQVPCSAKTNCTR
jgi:hypothetical protein